MFFQLFARRFENFRARLARRYAKRRLLRNDFTIISDDCWGGRAYAVFGLKCYSPFVGMGVAILDNLELLSHLREPGALDVLDAFDGEKGYPMIRTRHALMHGRHYESVEEFRRAYERRKKIMRWDRVFKKIDLGKPKYRAEDIARWNELKLPNSVALFPDEPRFHALKIHNGVAVPNWEENGARQFHISCRRFDVLDWLNAGRLGLSWRYRCAHFLLLDKYVFQRVRLLFSPRRSGGLISS